MFSVYPLIGKYLAGTAASGLFEARLGREEMGGETHVFSPAYTDGGFDEILRLCDHIVFNSFAQWETVQRQGAGRGQALRHARSTPNTPRRSTRSTIPARRTPAWASRAANFRADLLDGIDGLHFHTLCEQNSDALIATAGGGGRKIRRYSAPDELGQLRRRASHHQARVRYRQRWWPASARFKEKYDVEVYLEPGEAVALQRRVSGRARARHRGQRHANRHSGRFRRLPHAGRARDALPPAASRRRAAGRKAATPTGWPGQPALPAT